MTQAKFRRFSVGVMATVDTRTVVGILVTLGLVSVSAGVMVIVGTGRGTYMKIKSLGGVNM